MVITPVNQQKKLGSRRERVTNDTESRPALTRRKCLGPECRIGAVNQLDKQNGCNGWSVGTRGEKQEKGNTARGKVRLHCGGDCAKKLNKDLGKN